jgi:uncharacterized protein YdaU (DUF1376 family)
MKPDIYMPFYWPEFWLAVEGLDDIVIIAYLRLLSYYWHHSSCDGLENNNDKLQRICRMDGYDWNKNKAILFGGDGFFKLVKGKWRNKRADEEWAKSIKAFERKSYGGKLTAAKRWGSPPPPKNSTATS